MISSVNQTPSFGCKCAVIKPANTNLQELFATIKKAKNPNFPNLKFVEPGGVKMAGSAVYSYFEYIGKSKIKGTGMAKFIFDDGLETSQYAFQLPAFLKSIFGETRVVKL